MNSRRSLYRLTMLMVGAGLIAGCPTVPTPAPAPSNTPRPATPGPAPAPVAPTPAPEAPPPVVPMSPQAIQKAVTTAIELLEGGNEDQAMAELQRVLAAEPGHRLAQSLMRQIKEDPQVMFGRESWNYRVQAGESLSRIAQRFMNDVHLFYGLARYNDIKVPRQLAGGQTIRVPGKAPPPSALLPAPAPAAAPRPPAAAPAPAATPTAAPTPAPAPEAPAMDGKARADAIARCTRQAKTAIAKQNLNEAIRNWDCVLELDPDNRSAQLERTRAVDLKDRLDKLEKQKK